MTTYRFHVPAAVAFALALLGATPERLAAQEPMRAPPGQGESGPVVVVAPQTGQAADVGDKDIKEREQELDRARAAARAADPRLQGLEKAREAARKAQDQNGAKDCLSAKEARGAILAKKAVTLSQALRAARDAWDGEVIDYKLCTFDGVLAYDLTLLNGDGRVARVRVGAADGKLVNVR
ncbi:hypothetical protein IHQ68_17355 [Chelatococcus sambhunathii]|uniref:Peptidase propeptide and YPEB domain n=1 Tax=Chelatococcus sambhunathii TaxID=363953 RepID=A0ABU1DKA2_9HYPH|nr:hypothetical protein [Chelatococcus sambhunathii]MDR4308389.1 hypothetical protein [Chelatococcus sambhunathii]